MSSTEGVKSGCLPCGVGHFSASSTFQNEALRFKKDGLSSPQVLDDIAGAISELNALERIDLTPAKISALPEWEREIAEQAAEKSREIRHRLETVQNMDELRGIAVDTEEYYKHLNREWVSKRIGKCPTCQISTNEDVEDELDEVVLEEAPKNKLSEYGRGASEARKRLFDEIHQARNRKE